jgi:heme A synthase
VGFRDHRVLGAVGYTLVGLAILSFVAGVIVKVAAGHSLDTYYSARLVQWTYSGALITIVVAALVGIVAVALRLVDWYRRR